VKARLSVLLAILSLALHPDACAGDLSAGLFNSFKGFGISVDHIANDDIYNSFTVYADIYRMPFGETAYPGIKIVYLHYNRIATINRQYSTYDIFIAPGFSTGYVRDFEKPRPGLVTAADLSLAVKMRTEKNIDVEFGFLSEIGFISNSGNGKTQVGIYSNGLRQSWYPIIKLMYRF
jgi:hypothetical protein